MDYDTIDEQTRSLYRQGISAFGGISPTYRIALGKEAPVIVWDFHSLLVMMQMCFSFMLTDKDCDMRMCKHCKKPLSQAGKGMNFAARGARTSLMSINRGKSLMGANAKAKANAATAIPELIQIASNPAYEENRKEKHNKNAKYGWYRYDVRFALPVYEESVLVRYNIFHARLLINHAENGRKYLYDVLAVKKETSKP